MFRTLRLARACAAISLLATVGCAVNPGRGDGPAPDAVPPRCPFDPAVTMVVGDSVATEWFKYVTWPQGITVFSTSYGGSGYTMTDLSVNIGQRVQRQVDACGADLGNVILSAGIADLAAGQPVEPLIAAVRTLSENLRIQGIPVTWLTITPFSDYNRPGGDDRDTRRLAFNAWLTTPGSVTGEVIDCSSTLADPVRPTFLDARFYQWVGILQADNFHLSDDGYQAYAACISTALAAPAPLPD